MCAFVRVDVGIGQQECVSETKLKWIVILCAHAYLFVCVPKWERKEALL